MAKKLKKVMSLVLAVAMLITSVNLGMISVKADYDATGGLNVYFKYIGKDESVWKLAAINTWDTKDVTSIEGLELESIPVKKWGADRTLPQMEVTDGWFAAKVTGDTLKGIQFVYPINDSPESTEPDTIELVDVSNFALLPAGSKAVYYVYDGTKLTAYSDEKCTNVLDTSINLHFVNTMNWDIVKLNYWGNTSSAVPKMSEIKADENGWYSVNIIPDNTKDAGIQFYPDNWDRVYLLQQCLDIPGKDFWIVPFEEGNQKGYNILTVPTTITVSGDAEVAINNKITLTAKAGNGEFDEVKWESSDTEVATVDGTGMVTGIKEGTVSITAKSTVDSEIKDTIEITVKPAIMVSSISLSKETASLKKGQSIELDAVVVPENASINTVSWKTSNDAIATVNEKTGEVTGVAAGTATITATANDESGITANCEVTVIDEETVKVSEIAISGIENKKLVGDEITLNTSIKPEGADYTEVTYVSSNPEVVSVDEKGKVTAVAIGDATITATTDNMDSGVQAGELNVSVGDTFTLRDESAIGWDYNTDYAFRYLEAGKMEMVSKLKLTKGYYSFQCATDGWGKKIGNGAAYEILVKNDTTATVTIEYTTDPKAGDAKIIFTGTNEDDITTTIPEPQEVYTVVGVAEGEELDWFSVDKLMNLDEESGKYVYEWKGIEADKTYIYQLAKDGATFGYKYQISGEKGANFSYSATANGTLVITYDKETNAVSQKFVPGVSSVSLDKETATLTEGDTLNLVATVNPDDAGDKTVSWSSSNTNVATVDKDGKVTAVAAGSAKITVTTTDGEFTAECNVTVNTKKYKVTFKSGENVLDTQEVEYGKAATAPEVNASEGYTASWDTPFNNIKEDTIVNLVLTANKYNVVFKDGDTELKKEVVEYGKAAIAPTIETKEGYTFAWDKEFSAVKSDLVVNAVWTAKTYTVTFMNGTEVAKTETVAHGKSATAPELTKAGYVLSWDTVFTNITGDLTVTAKWTEVKKNQFVVKFVSDGQVVDTQAIDAGSAAKAPELTKEGYSLSWDKAFDKITEDTTITAVWTVKKYTVTFKDVDDILKTESVEYGKGATAPEVKAKEGYTFTWDKAFADIKADTVVSINWTANKYTVTFKDGERTLKTEEVEYGKSATAPEVEAKEGYSFEWNKAFAEIKEDTEVSVIWTINKYYVTFSDEDVVLKTEEVEYGKSATAPVITVKEGYTFAWDKEFTAIKGDTDVKVIWIANKYTVTFKDGNEVLKTEEVEYGKSATAPEVTAKEGYTYSWDKDIVEIKGNTEVNVVWTINKYTVTFKDDDKVLKAEEVEYGKAATAPELPTKTGYTAKWDIDFTNIKETTDVNVDWVINKYTVTFMNGKEEAAKVEVEYGKSATAPEVTKKGYSLTWDKAFDKVTKDITVTAVWTANKYKLTYDANGGKATSKSKQVTFGSKIGSFPTATRKGYVLKGWYSKKTGGTELTSTSKYATAGNATIYAQWTKVSVGATKVSKVKKVSKKSFQLTLKKVSGVKGYEVVYSTNKSFKSSKTVATNKTSVKVAKLNKATTYYVKARAYKTDSTGAKVYSSYSKVVKVTTKK